jgi:DNA-binding response OmpR family regulator
MKGRVLVVDDDANILEVLEMRLGAMGFEVIATTDAQRAVALGAEQRFDVALFDLRMDPLDGISLM